APPDVSTLSLHDALPIWVAAILRAKIGHAAPRRARRCSSLLAFLLHSIIRGHELVTSTQNFARRHRRDCCLQEPRSGATFDGARSEEHTSELQSREKLVC